MSTHPDINDPSANYLAGQEAMSVLRAMPPPPDNARDFHDAVEAALKRAGFLVRREAYCGVRESGVGRSFGFVDLLAQKHGGFVALELDQRSPRSGSLDKLRSFNAFRIVVLRGAPDWPEERGIDAIISIPVDVDATVSPEEEIARLEAQKREARRKDAERKRHRRAEQRRAAGKVSTEIPRTFHGNSADIPRKFRGQVSYNESSSLQNHEVSKGSGGGAYVDACARDDRTIREEATILASEVMTILGIEQDFIPPGWCGAPLWLEAGLRSGWKPDIVRIAAQRVARTKRDGPPTTFRYLGKPIVREHALAAAPIPSASVHPHPSGDSHGQTDQRELALFRRIVDKPGGLASLAVRRGRRSD